MDFPNSQILTRGYNAMVIDTETTAPFIGTFHASPNNVNGLLERLADSLVGTRDTDNIYIEFEEYLNLKNNDKPQYFISSSRKRLLTRLLTECNNLFTNNIYLTLIDDEEVLFKDDETSNFDKSGLVTLTRVLASREKGKILPASERNELLQQEFEIGTRPTSFHTDSILWIISLLEGDDSDCAGKERVLEYMNMQPYLNEIQDSIRHGVRGLTGYNETIQELLYPTRLGSERTNDQNTRFIHLCLTLFMANYSVGDIVNAHYFLMKANEMRFKRCEQEKLLLFLNNVILLKSA